MKTEVYKRECANERGRVGIAIPTLNAAKNWRPFADSLLRNLAALHLSPDQVVVIDSSSIDNTEELTRLAGFQFHRIPVAEFDHGGTRQLAFELLPHAELIVFLTQDAVLAETTAVATLLAAFADESVGAVYGRQLPKPGATPIETHARLFNYPDRSCVRSLGTKTDAGLKSVFLSNSFAAYRRSALYRVGGFSNNTILGEDMLLTARLHLAGWKTAYVAEASVFHSHAYSIRQEFRRYFDTGVLHSSEPWLIERFGAAAGEGRRFVASELHYLWRFDITSIPSALLRTASKVTGYKLGRYEKHLALWIKLYLSMNPEYWRRFRLRQRT